MLRVVRGEPSDEELAALLAVVAARASGATSDAAPSTRARRSAWGDPALATRPALHPGPGAWRRSALPH